MKSAKHHLGNSFFVFLLGFNHVEPNLYVVTRVCDESPLFLKAFSLYNGHEVFFLKRNTVDPMFKTQ